MSNFSFLWHDYETWGINPKLDRPLQFAAIRTDYDLKPIAEPINLYSTPPVDRLPNPEACLIINLSPQDVLKKDHLPEVKFIDHINQHMLVPHTCSLGYNSLRFDDEVTRFSLYRNLFEPYAREWKNGNSRWDLIDVLRLARSLRPDGINWPVNDEGKPSLKLTDLSTANHIEHTGAHDALADVQATLSMAKLLKTKQTKLYDFAFNNRSKQYVFSQLDLIQPKMALHFSGMYPTSQGNMAIVVPIARDPSNNNGIVVYDLSCDPNVLESDDIAKLNYLLFTKTEDLVEGEHRLPLKTVHANKCPIVVPLNTLTTEAISRFEIDLNLCKDNLAKLQAIPQLETKIQRVLGFSQFEPSETDMALYDGFFSDKDQTLMRKIHQDKNITLQDYNFTDSRLKTLAFRFKARNYPHTLNEAETQQWHQFIYQSLNSDDSNGLNISQFNAEIHRLEDANLPLTHQKILDELKAWGKTINLEQ